MYPEIWVTAVAVAAAIGTAVTAAINGLRKVETYNGTTNGSGTYTVTFPVAYASIPHVNPVCYPAADSITRVRNLTVSTTGFTVITEKNATVNLLGIDILGIGTAAVASVPVRVFVTETR